MIHSLMLPASDGILYITSSIASSNIERSPLAPVLRLIASFATARRAFSVKVSFTSSKPNIASYCLISEL